MGLQSLNIAHRVVLGNWTLHLGVLSWACGTEDMVCDLSIDDGAVVLIELSLIVGFPLANRFTMQTLDGRTLSHFPSVL